MMLLREYDVFTEWSTSTDQGSKFDAILGDVNNQYWFQLTPGKLLSSCSCWLGRGYMLTSLQSLTTGGSCMAARLSPARGGCAEDIVSFEHCRERSHHAE